MLAVLSLGVLMLVVLNYEFDIKSLTLGVYTNSIPIKSKRFFFTFAFLSG